MVYKHVACSLVIYYRFMALAQDRQKAFERNVHITSNMDKIAEQLIDGNERGILLS
jgi:hypothetical protein